MSAVKTELPLIQCGTCLWWDASEESKEAGASHCMRYPPSLVNDGESYSERLYDWPRTCTESWCGEWRENNTAMRSRFGEGPPTDEELFPANPNGGATS